MVSDPCLSTRSVPMLAGAYYSSPSETPMLRRMTQSPSISIMQSPRKPRRAGMPAPNSLLSSPTFTIPRSLPSAVRFPEIQACLGADDCQTPNIGLLRRSLIGVSLALASCANSSIRKRATAEPPSKKILQISPFMSVCWRTPRVCCGTTL